MRVDHVLYRSLAEQFKNSIWSLEVMTILIKKLTAFKFNGVAKSGITLSFEQQAEKNYTDKNIYCYNHRLIRV